MAYIWAFLLNPAFFSDRVTKTKKNIIFFDQDCPLLVEILLDRGVGDSKNLFDWAICGGGSKGERAIWCLGL